MPPAGILIMTQITPLQRSAATAVAAAGEFLRWASAQPGFVWGDVLGDPKDVNSFWLSERWASRTLRDAARLDPEGAHRLQKLETLLDRDEAAAYVPIDRFPLSAIAAVKLGPATVRADGAAPLTSRASEGAPSVIIQRFHLKPGAHDPFVAAERRYSDSLNGSGVIAVDLARHSDNPNRFCHYEIWSTAGSHQAYVDSFERQRFMADAARLLVEPEPSVELHLLARFVPTSAGETISEGLLVPPVDRAVLSPEARKAIESAPPVAFFDTIAHAQAALPPLLKLMQALMAKESALKPRPRLLAVLLVLLTEDVRYEWNRQLKPALAAGVTQEEIDALVAGWRGSALFRGDDRLVLHATAEALALGRVLPSTFTALLRHLGPPAAIELLLNVGHFQSMGQIILSTGLPPEPSPEQADDSRRPSSDSR